VCEKALAKHDAKMCKFRNTNGKKTPGMSFDIKLHDGKAWEVECNVKTF